MLLVYPYYVLLLYDCSLKYVGSPEFSDNRWPFAKLGSSITSKSGYFYFLKVSYNWIMLNLKMHLLWQFWVQPSIWAGRVFKRVVCHTLSNVLEMFMVVVSIFLVFEILCHRWITQKKEDCCGAMYLKSILFPLINFYFPKCSRD